MRVLVMLTYYDPHWTGLTRHAQRVAENLAARGHTVTVLTTQYLASLPREETIDGVHVIRIPAQARVSRGMVMLTFPVVAAREIVRHDIVHIHTPMFEALLVAGLCRILGKPLLMSHHGDLVMPAGIFNRFTERMVVGMMSRAGQMADCVTAYSADYVAHSRFLQQFASKLLPIYPPVSLPAPQPDSVAAWRRSLGLADKRLVGFAGRFVEEKGFDFLIDAIPLIQQIPDVHFIFAGETNVIYENFYQRVAPRMEQHKDAITLLGLLLDPQQLANFYAMCDVFSVPSRTDCFGLVQVEALLCGTPLVTANIPGARVVVQQTGMGRLVNPGDAPALAAGIIDVLTHIDQYRPDPAVVRATFDLQHTIDSYERTLAGLCRTTSTGAPQTSGLSESDRARLEVLLRNEADMAFRRRALRLVDWLELHDGEHVLDCGCGMGFYLMVLGELRWLRLTGLDGDLSRLRWAQQERVPAALLNGDILALPFSDACFDKIILSEVLEHLPDDGQALREILRVLKPEGILAISVPHARYPFWWDPINHIWIALGGRPIRSGPIAGIWSNHERLYEPSELHAKLSEAGFEVETVEEATHYSFPLIHFLVYGIGKPLIEHNLLPATLRASADRFASKQNRGSRLNPLNLGRAIFRLVDRLNDRPEAARRSTFVNVLAKARKPAATMPLAEVATGQPHTSAYRRQL